MNKWSLKLDRMLFIFAQPVCPIRSTEYALNICTGKCHVRLLTLLTIKKFDTLYRSARFHLTPYQYLFQGKTKYHRWYRIKDNLSYLDIFSGTYSDCCDWKPACVWIRFVSFYLHVCQISTLAHGPLTRYVNLRVVHAPGMPGTFLPPPTSNKTASYRSRHALRHVRESRTCRDAFRDR